MIGVRIMKTMHVAKQMKIYLAAILCLFAVSSCISEGDETVVLEKGNVQPRKMLLGEWKLSSKSAVDDDGQEQSEETISEEPVLEFTDDGNCTFKYPEGKTVVNKWSLSDDFYTLYISEHDYTIYTLGKNILVLIVRYDRYYLKYIYRRLSSPATEEGEIGGTADKNPYTPWSVVNKVTKIVTEGDTYTFEYDAKGRIMKYTTPSKVYTFTYDDTKVYLKRDGKIVNTGFVGSNGYLTTLWNGADASKGVSTFTYNTNKKVSKLEYKGSDTQTWTPKYTSGNMTSLYGDDSHTFAYGSKIDNMYSVDLDAFISAMYQWEWFMHDAEIIWGLFDFYGARSTVLMSNEKTSQWTNTFTYSIGGISDDFAISISQFRKGLNTNFDKNYKVYTTDK